MGRVLAAEMSRIIADAAQRCAVSDAFDANLPPPQGMSGTERWSFWSVVDSLPRGEPLPLWVRHASLA